MVLRPRISVLPSPTPSIMPTITCPVAISAAPFDAVQSSGSPVALF